MSYFRVVEKGTELSSGEGEGFEMNIRLYQLIVTAFLFPFIFIKNLKALAPFSMFANLLTLFCLVVILQYSVRFMQPIDFFPAFNDPLGLALYFGTAIYAFEGIGVVSLVTCNLILIFNYCKT